MLPLLCWLCLAPPQLTPGTPREALPRLAEGPPAPVCLSGLHHVKLRVNISERDLQRTQEAIQLHPLHQAWLVWHLTLTDSPTIAESHPFEALTQQEIEIGTLPSGLLELKVEVKSADTIWLSAQARVELTAEPEVTVNLTLVRLTNHLVFFLINLPPTPPDSYVTLRAVFHCSDPKVVDISELVSFTLTTDRTGVCAQYDDLPAGRWLGSLYLIDSRAQVLAATLVGFTVEDGQTVVVVDWSPPPTITALAPGAVFCGNWLTTSHLSAIVAPVNVLSQPEQPRPGGAQPHAH